MTRIEKQLAVVVLLLLGSTIVPVRDVMSQPPQSGYEAARERLVEKDVIPSGITDQRVLKAVLTTDRHEFVPLAQRPLAYYDMALPIGSRQTISSPFIVAYMTQSLDPQPTDRVLEIGTGSGYQAAILSPLVADVYSIEIVESLGKKAQRTLRRLKYENVHVKIGDGYLGWPEFAPFDKIIVTCSPESVPRPLIDQLKEGGQMVVPVGERYQQTLYLFTKRNGELAKKMLRPTLFVPMTGAAESKRQVLPDLAKVTLRNTSFEEEVTDEHLPGWYYQRQVEQVHSSAAPDGQHFACFSNETPGLGSRVLQGFAIDGSRFRNLKVAAQIKTDDVKVGSSDEMTPTIAVTFYDHDRRLLGQQWLGPWTGTRDWTAVSKSLSIPPSTREAILRLGLFGATGRFCVDSLSVTPTER